MTKKRSIFFFIPFGLIGCFLCYTWFVIVVNDYYAALSHYLGLVVFLPNIYLLFKDRSFKSSLFYTGIYLILATINVLSILPVNYNSSLGLSIGTISMWTPKLNGPAFIVFIIYCILNFDTLVAIYHDYKEAKGRL